MAMDCMSVFEFHRGRIWLGRRRKKEEGRRKDETVHQHNKKNINKVDARKEI